jgi:heptosyltransferase-1
VNRILVLRLSALGDVIHTLPAVAALRDTGRVSWVVEAPYRELVELVANVEAIPVRLKQWGRAPISSRNAMRDALRAMHGAETSIDFQGLVKSAMLGVFAGAKQRYGFDRNAIREKPALLFTNRKVKVDTAKHIVEQNLELARGAPRGAPPPPGRAPPPPPLHWDAYAPGGGKTDAIVILPGAGKANKLWPVERWRELARRLGDDVVIAWGPGEREHAEAIGARLAPPTTLRELAALLRSAQLVIGGDTGPLHLAAAVGTKVIGLYGPTDPRRNGPYGQLEHCIDEFRGAKCMDAIAVERVMKMVERVAAE